MTTHLEGRTRNKIVCILIADEGLDPEGQTVHHRLGSCYLIHTSLSSDKKKMQNKYFWVKSPEKILE